jgi:hypothetical protein
MLAIMPTDEEMSIVKAVRDHAAFTNGGAQSRHLQWQVIEENLVVIPVVIIPNHSPRYQFHNCLIAKVFFALCHDQIADSKSSSFLVPYRGCVGTQSQFRGVGDQRQVWLAKSDRERARIVGEPMAPETGMM